MPRAARDRGSRPDVLSLGRSIPLFQPGGPGNASRAVGRAAEPAILEVDPDQLAEAGAVVDVDPLRQVPGEAGHGGRGLLPTKAGFGGDVRHGFFGRHLPSVGPWFTPANR